MEKTSYQKSIFTPPGRANLFFRTFFYSYNLRFSFLQKGGDFLFLVRSILFLAGLFFLVVLFVSATPADPFLVFRDSGYELPSKIYAKDRRGKFVSVAEFYRFNRQLIQLGDEKLKGFNSIITNAFIATEDNNFLKHPGVDIEGIIRAVRTNLLAGRIKEGASTITQQAARLRFLSSERSFVRKAREAFLALLMELKYSKLEVMEIYLNEVPLGHGTIGVEAASHFYFDKSVSELRWGEAAVLASLTTSPRIFSPLRNIQRSRGKVRVVMRKMIESGYLSIEEAEKEYKWLEDNYYRDMNRSPNDTAFNRRQNLHPYVSEYIKSILPKKYRHKLYTGGLKIYTSINIDHQTSAEKVFITHLQNLTRERKVEPFRNFDGFDEEMTPVYKLTSWLFSLPEFLVKIKRDERDFQRTFIEELRDEINILASLAGTESTNSAIEYHIRNDENFRFENYPIEGSLVSIRPKSGEITAIVGGSGFSSKNQLLRFVHSKRPTGSAFKPLIYAAGIEYSAKNLGETGLQPLTSATIIDDSPLQYVNTDLSEYSPENYSLSYDGPIRLRRGLELSKNMVAVRVYERMQPSRINPIVEKILQMDKETPPVFLRNNATVALGTHNSSAMEMARAYSVFASGGKLVSPHALLYITDSSDTVLEDYRPVYKKYVGDQVISPGTAEIMTSLLSDAVEKGTGKGARLSGRQVAGKTGTTNRYKDAWFVGYTPGLVTAIHIGYDRGEAQGGVGAGGSVAAPVWGRYMQQALRYESPETFSFPESDAAHFEICSFSGKLPGSNCTDIIDELFLPGTEPLEICNEHGLMIQGGGTPATIREEDVLRDNF